MGAEKTGYLNVTPCGCIRDPMWVHSLIKEQIMAFVRYINYVNPGIKKHLKGHNWAAVAAAYNGPGYKDNNYDIKLAAAYKKFKDEK